MYALIIYSYDAYGLFHALYSHNPTQGLSTTYEQAHVVLDLLRLASSSYIIGYNLLRFNMM